MRPRTHVRTRMCAGSDRACVPSHPISPPSDSLPDLTPRTPISIMMRFGWWRQRSSPYTIASIITPVTMSRAGPRHGKSMRKR